MRLALRRIHNAIRSTASRRAERPDRIRQKHLDTGSAAELRHNGIPRTDTRQRDVSRRQTHGTHRASGCGNNRRNAHARSRPPEVRHGNDLLRLQHNRGFKTMGRENRGEDHILAGRRLPAHADTLRTFRRGILLPPHRFLRPKIITRSYTWLHC